MAINFIDVLQHGNANLGLVDSNFVIGGIRTKVANLSALYALSDATVGGVLGQYKDYSTLVYVEDQGTFYVLKNKAAMTQATSWEKLGDLIDVDTTANTINVSVFGTAGSYPVLFGSSTTGEVSVYTDQGITYNPSTNLLTVKASEAEKWSSNITLTVTGPVTGSVAFDGSEATETLALTLGNDSVSLGTHTTGSYVASMTAGAGITVGTAAGEGSTPVITNTDLGSAQNIFKNFTDGTNTAVADTNTDTFKFRGSNGVTVAVTNDDGTHGDNLLISLSSIPNTALATSSITVTGTGITVGTSPVALGGTLSLTAAVQNIAGTSNQIAVASNSGTYTLSLPNAVTMPGSLTVTGDLIVSGSTTSVNSTDTHFLDEFIYLNKPVNPLPNTSTLTYAGLYVYDQTENNTSNIVQANSPGLRYDYNNNKWQLRQDNNANAQDGWVDIITSANQTSLSGASVAETIQGTNTDKYISPNDIRTWTAYNTANIGITFPGSGVSNAAATTEVQYAKTVKAVATVTEANATAGFFSIYHGLGNVYPIVNVYVADGDDYYQVIPKLLVDDLNNVKIYIQGMTTAQTYHIGITG
jgi:hypothetical protein